MINKIFRIVFSDVGSPREACQGHTNFLAKIKVWYFSKFCLHGIAYDLERLFKNFSDIFGQPKRLGRAIPIFQKCLYHTYFGVATGLRSPQPRSWPGARGAKPPTPPAPIKPQPQSQP